MILGSMAAAALAGSLVLPVAGAGSSAGRGADTPPSSVNATLSANPLVSLIGAGFAAIGDLGHAVPVLGPIASSAAEHAFCAANDIPFVGAVTKASTDKFDKDQQQSSGCATGTSTDTRSSSKSSADNKSSADKSSAGTLSAGSPGSSPGSSLTISTSNAFMPGSSGQAASGSTGNTGGSTAAPASATSDHASAFDHHSTSDHSAPSDHTPASDHSALSDHKPTSDHSAPADHSATSDHPASAAATTKSKAAPVGKATTQQAATFPKGRFQLRQGTGANETCLVMGIAMSAVPGPCDASAAWTYQSGELHPATDSAACLIAAAKDLEMISVGSCATAKSWTSHWYLSGTRRLFVRDTDEHGSWRFLGAPGALVVGGVSQRNLPAVPIWSFPSA
jgi:hypothetical protein